MLYVLFEYDIVCVFVDEFVEVLIDVGNVIWIVIVNDV